MSGASDARRDPARVPRPIAALAVSAIVAATLLALFWPSLPFNDPAARITGPTEVGVIVRQVEAEGAAPRISAPAPDFEWIDPDGSRRSLAALRGRPVVVNFWATWCLPCLNEMPLLERAAGANAGMTFLAVDLDEDGPTIRAYFERMGLERLVPLLDVGLATSRRYALASVPSTFFIDAGGTIRHIEIGEMDEAELEAALEKVR